MTKIERDRLDRLIVDVQNTSFYCGEYPDDKDSGQETYALVFARANRAKRKLLGYITTLIEGSK